MMMVIGAGKPGKKEAEEKEGEEMSEEASPGLSGMARKKAAKGVLSAIESGDSAALDKALKAHYDACYEE